MEYLIFFVIAFACGFIYSYEPQEAPPARQVSFKLTPADCKAKM